MPSQSALALCIATERPFTARLPGISPNQPPPVLRGVLQLACLWEGALFQIPSPPPPVSARGFLWPAYHLWPALHGSCRVQTGPVAAKKQANGTRFSAGTAPPSASPTAGTGPGAALITDHDIAVRLSMPSVKLPFS